jgi:acyl-CoA synthetase (AMP-forming)/AMP-acid ligase II
VRTELYADPAGLFVHDLVTQAAAQWPERTAIIDTSTTPATHLTYADYAARVERLARGFVAAGIEPGERVAIFLSNSWEFAAAYHAATLAGATPTPLNPSYREREVRYQLENSGASFLVTDGSLIGSMNLAGLPSLRRVYAARTPAAGAEPLSKLLHGSTAPLPTPTASPQKALAALPYSSGTTGLPKGVMLSHSNLVTNVFQVLVPGELGTFTRDDVCLCALPLYHIYGLNVILNPMLTVGGTLMLMPRFDLPRTLALIAGAAETPQPTFMPLVPPLVLAFCQAAEHGAFPASHRIRYVKSGAAPLAPELARRFPELTGISIRQGYGMTEASPVTHLGFLEPPLYRPETIGAPAALTECLLLDESGNEVPAGEPGELVMRGPQFMLGYWNAPEATAAALRDLDQPNAPSGQRLTTESQRPWYFSGDVARRDAQGFYQIVDRRKEMIKYKGFPVAPAEVEAVLLEHPAVRDCGVIGRRDDAAGEIPCAFVVLRDDHAPAASTEAELCAWVAERLTSYKQPREVRFIHNIPRNPSGKILRRELRELL